MAALRSRRLENVLGGPLDDLKYDNIERLVTGQVTEEFDLDFKRSLYGNSDMERKDLATDVAALSNTAGGLLILGIEQDNQGQAATAPGVRLSDGEVNRMLQVLGQRVVPGPTFQIIPVSKPGHDDHGFYVIAVLRDPLAPHAVIVNDGLRYPRRNGRTIRYLTEPEVAAAYRDREAGAHRQAARVEEIEQEAMERLDSNSEMPWVVVSLVPDIAGDLFIDGGMFTAFRQEITGGDVAVIPFAGRIRRASVGRRRLLADGTMNGGPFARGLSLELHTDGSGVCAMVVPDLSRRGGAQPSGDGQPVRRKILDEALTIAVVSGLTRLGQHARDRAAAAGNALIRAQIYPISPHEQAGLMYFSPPGFFDQLGDRILTTSPPAAEAVAELDGLAQPSRVLIEASALLVNEIGQAFGVAEMRQLSRAGQLRRRYWSDTQMVAWAEQHGIEITDDTVV